MEKGGPRLSANRREQQVLLSLLRDLRRKAGLRKVDMTDRLGKPQAFVSYYGSGARRLDLLELRRICQVLGLPLTSFVRRFEEGAGVHREEGWPIGPVGSVETRELADSPIPFQNGSAL